jgi:hypothetical protein
VSSATAKFEAPHRHDGKLHLPSRQRWSGILTLFLQGQNQSGMGGGGQDGKDEKDKKVRCPGTSITVNNHDSIIHSTITAY